MCAALTIAWYVFVEKHCKLYDLMHPGLYTHCKHMNLGELCKNLSDILPHLLLFPCIRKTYSHPLPLSCCGPLSVWLVRWLVGWLVGVDIQVSTLSCYLTYLSHYRIYEMSLQTSISFKGNDWFRISLNVLHVICTATHHSLRAICTVVPLQV
jgi:hypothetical protein